MSLPHLDQQHIANLHMITMRIKKQGARRIVLLNENLKLVSAIFQFFTTLNNYEKCFLFH